MVRVPLENAVLEPEPPVTSHSSSSAAVPPNPQAFQAAHPGWIGGRLIILMNEYDPHALARRHYRENLWLRSVLEDVAQELERMATRGQGDTRVLLGRAQLSHLADLLL